jgi:hypothetical protein
MEITTDNEEENEKTGHYYLEVVIGYLNNIAMLFKIPSKLIFLSTELLISNVFQRNYSKYLRKI